MELQPYNVWKSDRNTHPLWSKEFVIHCTNLLRCVWFRDWLNPGTTDKSEVQKILDAMPEPVLPPRVVTDRVNSVRNNGPELIDPAT